MTNMFNFKKDEGVRTKDMFNMASISISILAKKLGFTGESLFKEMEKELKDPTFLNEMSKAITKATDELKTK